MTQESSDQVLHHIDLYGDQVPYDRGFRGIAELVRRGKLTRLDLSHQGLSNLPPEIGTLTSLTHLMLHHNRLTALPPEIGQLTNLTWLDLSGNDLATLVPAIGQLTNLTYLSLRGNQLSSVPPEIGNLCNLTQLNLRRNHLNTLPHEIGKLTSLRQFSLSVNNLKILPEEMADLEQQLDQLSLTKNGLTSLPPQILRLTHLRQLFLSHNQLTGLPPEIVQLAALSQLDLRNNELTCFPQEIVHLSELTSLFLSHNQLTRLPPEIIQLRKLNVLYLQNNQLTRLPPEIAQMNLTLIPIRGNPLVEPPIEIAKHGIKAIKAYYRSLSIEKTPLSEVKVLFVGDGGSGKTSLMKRLLGEPFNPSESQTHGINIKRWSTSQNGTTIHVHFWDFGGQQIMHATHQFFLSRRSLYVLVLDGRKDEDAEYWLKLVESFGGDSPILVVLNKMDEHPSYDLNRVFLKSKYKGVKGFYPVSCFNSRGIDAFMGDLQQALSESELPRTYWPKPWFDIKTSLESMEHDFISYAEYQSICVKSGIEDPGDQDILLEFLNDLGIVLHFRDLDLFDTHVLEPRWVTEAVYKIINSKELAMSKGLLPLTSLSHILKPSGPRDRFYPKDRFPYIINLMKKFELCYELDSSTMLVPQLLDVQKPQIDFNYDASLRFFIQYDFLPKSVIPRFIVNMRTDIKGDLRWRTGVVLEDPSFQCHALVEADEGDKRIYVNVLGHQKRDYFAVIRYSLFSINSGYEKIQAVERVPMPDQPWISVSYEHLIRLERLGEKTYFPDGSQRRYDIKNLLGTIQTESKTEEEILHILRKLKTEADTSESLMEKANKVVLLQPNFFGIGMNLNNLVARLFPKAASRGE